MAVEQDHPLLRDRGGVLVYELGDFLEGTTEDYNRDEHLLLAALDAVRVHVASLHVREEQLSRGGGV